MNLNDLSIGKRLAASFALIIVLLILISVLAYTRVTVLDTNIQLANNDRYPKTVLAHRVKDAVNEVTRNMRNILLLADAARKEKEYAGIEAANKVNLEALAQLEKTIVSERGRADMKSVLEARGRFVALRDKFVALAKADKVDEANPLLINEIFPVQQAYFEALDKLIEGQSDLMQATSKESETVAERTRIAILVMALLATGLSGVIALLVTRRITGPINEAVAVARRVADGDLTSEIRIKSKDETGQMLQALKDMNQSLVNIVSQVRSGTETIATASAQIAAGNMDLSSRTEQQASSLEETAASMEELASTVTQNTENARQANQMAQSSSEVALQGGAVVGDVVQTMDRINASARKIVDIISVIDGIAFQTNILALNAAVEAARAGEQGRGFAVVASEVRNLAQRSAGAAKEIKQLIDASVEAVDSGTAQVARAGSTMDDVVSSVKRVTDIMAEIASASNEQSSGIAQVSQAVTQMDEVTQQNAALVEQAAAAAQSLQDQSAALAEVVSVFKISGPAAAAARPATRPRAPAASKKPARPAQAVPRVSAAAKPAKSRLAPPAADDWEEF